MQPVSGGADEPSFLELDLALGQKLTHAGPVVLELELDQGTVGMENGAGLSDGGLLLPAGKDEANLSIGIEGDFALEVPSQIAQGIEELLCHCPSGKTDWGLSMK
jgi:hypothetical protein